MSKLALTLIAENKKTRATFLDLGNCSLTEVPDEIGELVWLNELVLGNGFFSSVCHWNSSEDWWYSIDWHESKNKEEDNNILRLNPVFKQLNNLQCLWLNGNNNLIDIGFIANLNTLSKLDISYSQVSDLSPLSNLFNLAQLYTSNTPVSDLRPLSNLIRLQELYISNTPVTDLSPLVTLIEKHLPVIWKTCGNYGIYVENCPLTVPPEAIIKQGRAAILNYLNEKQTQGSDYLYEAKLLLVGEGGAGKTSLLRRLYQRDLPLPEENETTKGIDIHQYTFTIQDEHYPNGRDFRLNVWDFGGQEIYHSTHQFFLTQRSLYILLDDTRKDDKTVHDEIFKYWLDAVDLLSEHSPVLIFQNEKGGRSKAIDLAGIKGKYVNVKEKYFGNLELSSAADELRNAIEFHAQQLPHIGEELPAKWIAIRADIEKLAKQQPTISLDEYFNLYKKYLPFDETKALLLSQYFHDLGVFLHFKCRENDDDNKKLLERIVILQNHWATEAVFKILDDETVKTHFGRFTDKDCQRLWSDFEYKRMHLELRALMEKFELCYLLPDSNPKTWLATQLLPPSKPAELNDWAKIGDLLLRYRYDFLPKGMINRLMVRKHYLVPRPELAWLTGVLFERNDTQVLVELAARGNEIVLRAKGFERKELLSVIATDLEALNNTFQGLSEKLAVLVPCCCSQCRIMAEPESYEKKHLLKRKQDGKTAIECPTSYEDVKVEELLDGIQVKQLPDWSKENNMKKIFISYSKSDSQHKDLLLKHLSPLRDNDKLVTWHDSDILAGEEWDERIKQELNAADIVLYLVSVHSLSTAYIQKMELPFIEQRCQKKQCKLVPIITDFCDWEETWVAKYNGLPVKGISVTDKQWTNENQAWLEVIKGIKKILQ